jgi:hypothetical protein
MRRRAVGKGLALLLLVAAIIANINLRAATRAEGQRYFDRVWSDSPGDVAAWAALWAAWQVTALAVLFWPPLVRGAKDRT